MTLSETSELAISKRNNLESRLLIIAAIFLGFYSIILTFSPAVRARSIDANYRWEHWVAYLTWLAGFILAHHFAKHWLPLRDPYLLPISGLMSGWGMLTIWRLFPNFGLRQTIWLAISLGILILGFRLDSRLNFLKRYKYLWLLGGLLLAALTLMFGTNPLGNGPRLWLGCCNIYLQPSEPLKLLLIVYLAAFFSTSIPFFASSGSANTSSLTKITSWLPLFAPTMVLTGLALSILVVQRDLGTASIFIILYAGMAYLATNRKQLLIIAGASLLLAGLIGYFTFDVVRLRLDTWINPWTDPSGSSYQVVQSLLAIANGGVFGRGPGLGSPTLVPIPHSDFIFTAITEEGGLIGALGLLIVIALFAQRGLHIAMHSSNRFHQYLAGGLTIYIVFQSIIIMGGNLRLLPLTGVTLPFVSYGGSSLVTSFISILLLLHISNNSPGNDVRETNLRPYYYMGTLLLACIAGLSLALGWWAVQRGPDLLTRTDNPRRSISDRFVKRGTILDRENTPINISSGEIGDYIREYHYPDLSSVVGYTDAIYGQSGIEASMDETLRGLNGNPALTIWWNHLLYGHPPAGIDVRTSLDLNIQKIVDKFMDDHNGSIVLLNPESGEILAMATHPTFDANQLDEDWENLIHDQNAPLVNRGSQGLYPPGTILGPLLMAEANANNMQLDEPINMTYIYNGETFDCAIPYTGTSLAEGITSGCPGTYFQLAETLELNRINALFYSVGLFTPPAIRLPSDSGKPPDFHYNDIYTYNQSLRLSPIQLALALAPLSNNGQQPAPRIVTGINTNPDGWKLPPALGEPSQIFPEEIANQIADQLKSDTLPIWESVSTMNDDQNPERYVSWYVAGTVPDWSGTPIVMVVLIEEHSPNTAIDIGRQLLNEVIRQ
jgi:cell division protein FtsW (lipid II flippase)